mgnify:CR=1 FL=1
MNTARKHRTGYFTLVEALLFLLAVSILAITAVSMLYYLYRSWDLNRVALDMQRDATAAVVFLKHEMRGAKESEVDVDTAEIRIDTDSGNRRFYIDGGDTLMFDPDTGVVGDETPLIRGRLVSFTPEQLAGGVRFEIVVAEDDNRLKVQGMVEQRN